MTGNDVYIKVPRGEIVEQLRCARPVHWFAQQTSRDVINVTEIDLESSPFERRLPEQ